jgi:hypothetical protein
MNVLIYANCQAHQIVMGLSLMLLGKVQLASIDINSPEAKEQLEKLASGNAGSRIDFVLTNHNVDDLLPFFDRQKIIAFPTIHFGGFHPDVSYFASTDTPSKPLFFKQNPTISALALWGHLRGLPVEKTLALYREDVFEALGYMDYFDVCCQAALDNYAQHQFDTALIERFIASRDVFMYGPLHPKLAVTLNLCQGICERLDVAPTYSPDELDGMLPDPLQNEYAWGCFPPLAARLGVEGSWLIRHYNEVFPSLTHYLQAVFAFLDGFPRGSIQFFDKDKTRFEEFHKINDVLSRHA